MRELNRFEDWLVRTVEQTGWAVLNVSPRADSNDPEEWFSYSIGLPKTFGWPELICFGLSSESRKLIINNAVEECRRKQWTPVSGMRLSDVLNNFDVLFSEAADVPESYFGSANWFATHTGVQRPIKRLQMLWPDARGFFPGDACCAADVVAEQTPMETE